MSYSSPIGTFSRRAFLKIAGAFGSGAFLTPLSSWFSISQAPGLIISGSPELVQRWSNWLNAERFVIVPNVSEALAVHTPLAAIGLESGAKSALDMVHNGYIQAAVIFEDATVDLLPDFARLQSSAARVLILRDSMAADSRAQALQFLKRLTV